MRAKTRVVRRGSHSVSRLDGGLWDLPVSFVCVDPRETGQEAVDASPWHAGTKSLSCLRPRHSSCLARISHDHSVWRRAQTGGLRREHTVRWLAVTVRSQM